MRCFLAVPVAEPALSAAQGLLATLRAHIAGVRWSRPETLHVTMHFFGSIPDDEVARALDAVTPVAAGAGVSSVRLDTLGSFPGRGWPRVLWLGCSTEPEELVAFALRCRQALATAHFEVEERRFRAHCTLGRPRVPWSSAGRAAWDAAKAEGFAAPPFAADRLVLYESHPGPGGSRYEARATLPFTGSGAGGQG